MMMKFNSLLKFPGLQYIWKHLSNHKVFEAHSVPVHAWWRFVAVDARQKKLVVAGPKRRHLWTSLHRLRVNIRGSFCPKTIISDTTGIGKLFVSFSHRLRVNGAWGCVYTYPDRSGYPDVPAPDRPSLRLHENDWSVRYPEQYATLSGAVRKRFQRWIIRMSRCSSDTCKRGIRISGCHCACALRFP